jgi:tRNA (guanine37-N1)-methyltransferase
MSWTAHILTIFPSIFDGFLSNSLFGKARAKGIAKVNIIDIRDFADGRHRNTDDAPYGGGAGMVMSVDPIVRTIESLGQVGSRILLTPQGRTLNQSLLWDLSRCDSIALLCGRYEGIDERIQDYIDLNISIGDYILNGGEVASMVILEGVVRLLPNVVGNPESIFQESHSDILLEYPQFTRPANFRGKKVPEVLLSGNHQAISRWRRRESLIRTKTHRPDLWERFAPSEEDIQLMKEDE